MLIKKGTFRYSPKAIKYSTCKLLIIDFTVHTHLLCKIATRLHVCIAVVEKP